MDKTNLPGEEEDGRCMAVKLEPTQLKFREGTTAGVSQLQNPLQNRLIFHHVLSYLNNLKDLKNCRLVHSTWTAEASNLLKTKSIIKISKEFLKTSKEDVISMEVLRQLEVFQPHNLLLFPTGSYRPDYSRKNWLIVKKHIKKLSNGVKCLKLPFTQIRLHQDRLHCRRGLRTQSFTEILEYNFQNLVHLTLGDSNFSWPNSPPPPIHSIKQIDWITNYKPSQHHRPAMLKLLEGVFKLAPNLESLNLRTKEHYWDRNGYNSPRYSYFVKHQPSRFYDNERPNIFLDYFNSHPSSCSNLKDLILEDLSPLDIDALSNLKINLRSLKLSTLPRMANYQKFHDFLKRQNGTLQRLRLVFPPTPNDLAPHFTFPCLPKLKKLKLVHNNDFFRKFLMTFDHVEYAKMFPVLQSLVIKYIRKTGGITTEPKDSIWSISPVYGAFLPLYGEDLDRQVCRTLRVLKLPYPDQPQLKREKDNLFGIRERLSIMFPNVHNQHLDIGRARVADGHPYLPAEPFQPGPPVPTCTRSKSRKLIQN